MKHQFLLFLIFKMALLKAQTQMGNASFYTDAFEGKSTSSGEKYHANKLTAAHKTLSFGTVVKVTNLVNNESVNVTINDRGPDKEGRVIDLSRAAAARLKFINQGTAEVNIEIVEGGDGKGKFQPTMADLGASEESEFYDFDISKVQPKGFGAQLGRYQELSNLYRLTNNLKKTYRKKVVVKVSVVKGVKYYSLIVGSFSSQVKAERFVSGLKKQFSDAFVLDYARQ